MLSGRSSVVLIMLTATGCGYWVAPPPSHPIAPAQWSSGGDESETEPATPSLTTPADRNEISPEARNASCTVDQILVMKKAGLSDDQVKAACSQ